MSGCVRQFRRLADDYLAATNERFPEAASRLGHSAFNARLGKNDPATRIDQVRHAERSLAAVEALPEAAFAGDDWLDRRLFVSMLRAELLFDRDLARWRNNPQVHCDTAVDAIFDLVVRHAGRLSAVRPALEARLRQLPDFLAAGAAGLRRPIPLWTTLAAQACEGAVAFLKEIEPELVRAGSPPDRARGLIASACAAFADYARAAAHKAPGPARGFAIGRHHFEFLMRERLGLDWSLPEALANGRHLVALMQAQVEAEAARLGHRSAREALAEAAAAWTPHRPLLDEYRAVTQTIKERIARRQLVTLPQAESLRVLPAPAFLRHQFPTAAYNAPAPFATRKEGIFWVNDLSLGLQDPARRAAEVRQHFGLELTAAHEAYPGHHLQFAIQSRHPSRLRRLANHSIYYEGWTMWCERMAVERGLVASRFARLQQAHDALWRAWRIVIDCGLHDGSLSHRGAARLLEQGVHFTPARARGDVNWYTSAPTVPMSYLLGRIELEKLHRRFVQGERWPLRKFNDWVLSHGAVPWTWIAAAHDQRAAQ